MIDFPDFSDHVIFFLLGVLLPVVSGFRSARKFRMLSFDALHRNRFYLFNSIFLWFITIIVLANWWLHGRPAVGLGITQPPLFSTIVIILSVGFTVLYIIDISVTSSNGALSGKRHWTDVAPFLPTRYQQLPAYIFMCITAGICEEVIFRGFLITYVKAFIDSDLIAVIIPAAVFAAAHYYQRTSAVIKIFVLSVIFGFIFLKSGSLWIVMFLHFAIDITGGLIIMHVQRKRNGRKAEEVEERIDDIMQPPGEPRENTASGES